MSRVEELVKFDDGRYGIRRGSPGRYEYKDLKSNGHWWTTSTSYFMSDCRASKKIAMEQWINSKDVGTPIDPNAVEPPQPEPQKKSLLSRVLGFIL